MALDKDSYEKLKAKIGESDFGRFLRDTETADLRRTLEIAKIRCMPFEVLLGHLKQIHVTENASLIIYRFCEIEINSSQETSLITILQDLFEEADKLPSKDKARLDRYLQRLLRKISPQAAALIAGRFFEHPRKVRRQIAYNIFRNAGLTPDLAHKLLKLYQEHKEQDYLELIARCPTVVGSLDVDYILSELKNEYWRTRLIQLLIEQNGQKVELIANRYPYEFVHAAGRTKDAKRLQLILNVFDGNKSDIKFLSIFAWCLGVLGAGEYLHLVEQALDQINNSWIKID